MHAKWEVKIMINKGIASFFACPLLRGARFCWPKMAGFFLQITSGKLRKTFLIPMNYIFCKLHSLAVLMTYDSSIPDHK